MRRQPIPKQIETNILVSSRRRCCICFGLNRDVELKSGQIAHLDKRSNNSVENNLAFLCLVHHDEYDSSTSQRKGLTMGEVLRFKQELITALGSSFSQSVHFGELLTPPNDPFAGSYIRIGSSFDSAEIKIIPLPDDYLSKPRYFVEGFALWGSHRESGPNMGTFDFVGTMDNLQEINFVRDTYDGGTASTFFDFFETNFIEIRENNISGQYGMNVQFDGIYRRSISSQ